MKSFIRKLLSIWMSFVSKIYPYNLSQRIKGCRDLLYTMWIRNFLGDVGEHSCFKYPLRLQGCGLQGIHIGERTCFQAYCILGAWERYGKDEHYEPEIVIGNECNIGEYTHITACNKITIGDGLLTGRFVYIGDNSHGSLSWEEADIPPVKRHLQSKGEIIIGKNVWIGDKVTILGGVTIGDNVIIGAGSIVTHDVPSNCMAAGMPAKIVKGLK